jgi:hypothetical protein
MRFRTYGRAGVVKIEQLGQAALDRNSLLLRSLTQDFLSENRQLDLVPKPDHVGNRLLSVSASLIELFAERRHQEPPAWVHDAGPMSEPVYLVSFAETMKHLRELCESQSPPAMKKRGLLVPPNFLQFA